MSVETIPVLLEKSFIQLVTNSIHDLCICGICSIVLEAGKENVSPWFIDVLGSLYFDKCARQYLEYGIIMTNE